MGDVLIELRDLTKVFGAERNTALKLLEQGANKEEVLQKTGCNVGVNRVSLTIGEGELFVIMGLSGSGKSTLLRCINRLIEPTSGSIMIGGQEITQLEKTPLLQFRQKKTAMVFQQFALFPHRTVLDNVAFGLEIQKVDKEERRRVAAEKLALVGLEGYGQQYPGNLSGGMQQRVGLARALANDPDILLMDEAFSALDPLIRDEMQNELLALQETLHKTIVFITHDLNEALKLGDHIALMKDGALVQVGTPEEIVSSPADEYVERFVRGVDVSKVFTASDVMKRPSPLLRLKDGPGVALHKLQEAGLSSGFVVDERNHLQGVISANTLADSVKAKKKAVSECTLEEAISVDLNARLDELVNQIVQTNYPLAVIDDNQRLVGLVFRSAILESLARGGDTDASEDSSGDVD